ncbi:hypothetical protein DFQ28_002289 [Apophysomyces sp. BC1034]|nr:hypothetical protein DFQ30_003984 [Apophysomyces sp. BC1015]KAG0178678.1 hypothetical protein DFQ29_003122 [Apophysomyces sp. BC1021]KAG0190252.1 hypothetical protein DFQ28_002289 [Apophysomyces sp. BC1034]
MSSSGDSSTPTFSDALKTVKLEDFKDVNRIPCARNSILYGMGAGLGLGSIRYIATSKVPSAANWAVGAFCGVSIIAFEMCQMQRKQKLEKLHLIVKETESRRPTVVNEHKGAFQIVVDGQDLKKE